MNPISWIAEKIVGSVATLIGSMVIARVETETLKNQTQALSELEAEARKYEAEGNPKLAEVLRKNAESLANGNPGERTARIEASFRANDVVCAASSTTPKKITAGKPEKKKRGRPPKNATGKSNDGSDSSKSANSQSGSTSESQV